MLRLLKELGIPHIFINTLYPKEDPQTMKLINGVIRENSAIAYIENGTGVFQLK